MAAYGLEDRVDDGGTMRGGKRRRRIADRRDDRRRARQVTAEIQRVDVERMPIPDRNRGRGRTRQGRGCVHAVDQVGTTCRAGGAMGHVPTVAGHAAPRPGSPGELPGAVPASLPPQGSPGRPPEVRFRAQRTAFHADVVAADRGPRSARAGLHRDERSAIDSPSRTGRPAVQSALKRSAFRGNSMTTVEPTRNRPISSPRLRVTACPS